MRIRFLANHNYKRNQNETTAYRVGHVADIPEGEAQKLIDAGKAEAMPGSEPKERKFAPKGKEGE